MGGGLHVLVVKLGDIGGVPGTYNYSHSIVLSIQLCSLLSKIAKQALLVFPVSLQWIVLSSLRYKQYHPRTIWREHDIYKEKTPHRVKFSSV